MLCLNDFTQRYNAAITVAVLAIERGDFEAQSDTTDALGALIDENPVNFRILSEMSLDRGE